VEMKIDASKIKAHRAQRAWSQEQLAAVADLSLRTVQRIERSGVASNESVKALAAVFETDVQSLSRVATGGLRPRSALRVGMGFAAGAFVGIAFFNGVTASALDYTVRTFINSQPVATRTETKADLRPITIPVLVQGQEQARVRILASVLDSGNVRLDLVLYDCNEGGCSRVSQPAMETKKGMPARVEWAKDTGEVIAYEITPNE